jgi:hypothetical protein
MSMSATRQCFGWGWCGSDPRKEAMTAELANPRRRLVLGAGILLASQSFHPAIAAEKSKKRGAIHATPASQGLT